MTQAKLLVVGGGDGEQQEFELATLPVSIGRGRENHITLPHPLVSRRHCEIFETVDGMCIRDLGSLNGTYVGNQRIEGEHPLRSGDLLTVGIVTFRAIVPEAVGAEPSLCLESIFEDETVDLDAADTRLSQGGWDPSPHSVDTERAKGADARTGDLPSQAPRKAK